MKVNSVVSGLVILFLLAGCSDRKKNDKGTPKEGISRELAISRKSVLSDIHYELHFIIPEDKDEPINGTSKTSFNYAKSAADRNLEMDFKERADKIISVKINGSSTPVRFKNEHIILSDSLLREGKNAVEIEFIAGDEALNRREDYMYTLFVPDRARSAFPNFEQPDLKAEFELRLTIPSEWQALANGEILSVKEDGNTKVVDFKTSAKLPTYLFSFVAGQFQVAKEPWRGKEITLLYREPDADKIDASLGTIFSDYKKYILFYEEWTQVPYPFDEYGMVSIPNFQFGGMEHPGAVLLSHSTLFLPEKATKNQLDGRTHLIAHEVAHQWFGDLVTMGWFDDVWTKEVFANFMAAKATANPDDEAENNLLFVLDHVPGAYNIDRTAGANPIHSQLANLQDANSMYGAIIYQKAPIMMQQLEMLMGEEAFRVGLQKYLKTYAFDNATWDDLIRILDELTAEDLMAWNEVWVNTPGRPIFDAETVFSDGKVSEIVLKQTDPSGANRIWPQIFNITLQYADGKQHFTVKDTLQRQELTELAGLNQPQEIWYNSNGTGYGVMPADTQAVSSIMHADDAVTRASAYINLYENMLEQRYFKPAVLLHLFVAGLKTEPKERSLSLLGRYINSIYWTFLSEENRAAETDFLEKEVWAALESQSASNNKKEIFKIFQNIFESGEATDRLYTLWKTQNPPQGVHLTEEDYTGLAYALMLRKDYDDVPDEQYDRIKNPDMKARFTIIRPVLSHDKRIRDEFFAGLGDMKNRANEAAVLQALGLLHHPLRQKDSEKYLQNALEWLPEIQRTNSLFFPERWAQANLNQYNSKSAGKIVQQFLDKNPKFNPKLKEKVLQAADNLTRAQGLK